MLMQELTHELIESWKKIHQERRDELSPNRKTGAEVLEYLKGKYILREENDKAMKELLAFNVMQNDCHRDKIPSGREPDYRMFLLENQGAGGAIYEKQDEIFRGKDIVVGVELESGFFIVEGSSLLWDEIFAFRGLDEEDLDNYYLVAEYLSCREKFSA